MQNRYKKLLFFISSTLLLFTFNSYARDMNTGIHEFENGNYHTAHNIFHHLAQGGCSDAMWALGMIYYEGNGVSQDYRNAYKWFSEAAQHGDPDAMNTIGFMYETGKGVSIDLAQAAKWYEKAVEYGSVNAMYCLAIMNLKQNKVTDSYKWYKLAERYNYEFSDDDIRFLSSSFKPFLENNQFIETVRPKIQQWISRHPDYQHFLDALNSSGPNC